MITTYAHRDGRLEPLPGGHLADAVWIDLMDPTPDERRAVETKLGLSLPSLEAMSEIELSSRLYEEDDGRFLTLIGLQGLDGDAPERTPVTCILKGGVIVTLRHAELKTFTSFAARATRSKAGPCETGELVLLGLFEALIGRLADTLEQRGAQIDTISHEVFRNRRRREDDKTRDLEGLIGRIGLQSELIDLIQESIVSLSRAVTYHAATNRSEARNGGDARRRVKMIQRDADSLSEHALFLSDKTNFLLDAALGLITLEQNKIIKIFSIVSVFFMPPTLVASVYGMNFDRMPELHWTFGYPLALILMVVLALVPFLVFKRKGWL